MVARRDNVHRRLQQTRPGLSGPLYRARNRGLTKRIDGETTMPMPKDFADWYRTASISPTQELLEQRWKGIEEVAADLTASQLIALLRMSMIRQTADFRDPE